MQLSLQEPLAFLFFFYVSQHMAWGARSGGDCPGALAVVQEEAWGGVGVDRAFCKPCVGCGVCFS